MRPVNLLPDARHDPGHRADTKARKTRLAVVVAIGAVLLVSLLLGVELVQVRHDVSDKRATLAAATNDLAKAQAEAATPSATETELQARLTALTTASSSRLQWDGLLADLAAVMPKGAWLTSLKASSPASAAATATAAAAVPGAAPTAFLIDGYARSQSIIAQTLDRLALIPALSNVSLQQSQRGVVVDRDVIQFSVAADVRRAVR